MKTAGPILVAIILVTPTAGSAEPGWLCQNFPKWKMCRAEPPPAVPLPPQRDVPAAPQPPPMVAPMVVPSQPAAPTTTRAPRKGKSKQKTSAPAKQALREAAPVVAAPAPTISCAEARQGVGMPCFLIVANSHRYDQLTNAQKCQANACLTRAERDAIKSCFPEKKLEPRC